MIKIIIYHGHMHKIILNEDIKDKRQNPIERIKVMQKGINNDNGEYFTESI